MKSRRGLALQLCALRCPPRVLRPGALIPIQVVEFIAFQLDIPEDAQWPPLLSRVITLDAEE